MKPGEVRSGEGLGRTLVERLREWLSKAQDEQWCTLPAADLREAARDLALLDATVQQMKHDVHSCHPGCTMWGCVNQRLREQLEAAESQAAKWRDKFNGLQSVARDAEVFMAHAYCDRLATEEARRRIVDALGIAVSP